MSLFALAGEGVTDQIVIENILCGHYKNIDDLDDEITYLQPPFDETDKKQKDHGGWEILLSYLGEKRFRDDVLNSDYIIIQIDTDVSEHKNFGVSHYDSQNKELPVAQLIDDIKQYLIEKIGSNFYKETQEKIIFAISVHSLECWILSHFEQKKEKTKNCLKALEKALQKSINKNYKFYAELSRPFTKHNTLLKTVAKNRSFKIFISNLPSLDPDV